MLTPAKRLISHLAESGNFSNKDLAPVHEILRKYKDITGRNVSTDDLRVISFLDAQISSCLIALKPLQEYLDEISPQLLGVLERLVSLRRCIKAAESRKRVLLNMYPRVHSRSLGFSFRSRTLGVTWTKSRRLMRAESTASLWEMMAQLRTKDKQRCSWFSNAAT